MTAPTSDWRNMGIDHIVPAPTNPRTAMDSDSITEMAESITEYGILQPLLVRPVGDRGLFEIVCGHRRLEAAKVAGFKTVPVTVREMSDSEAHEARIVENLQREDVHPADEAEAFRQLRDNGNTVEEIAAKIGKSISFVHRRVALATLPKEVSSLLRANKLTVAHALLIVPIKHPEDQIAAANAIANPPYRDRPLSVDEARHLIRRKFMLRLADAPWDRRKADLVPEAGACTGCTKRTGAQGALFDDEPSKDDLCTDADCYKKKSDAEWARRKAMPNVTVMPEEDAAKLFKHGSIPYGGPWIGLDDAKYVGGKTQPWRRVLGAKVLKVLKVTLARTPSGAIHEMVRREDVAIALTGDPIAKTLDLEPHKRSSADMKAKREQEAAIKSKTEVIAAIANAAATKFKSTRGMTDAFWAAFAHAISFGPDENAGRVAKRRGIDVPKGSTASQAIRDHIQTQPAADQIGAAIELVMWRFWNWGSIANSPIAMMAAALKVDAAGIEKKVRAELKAKHAERTKKKAPAKKSPTKAKTEGKSDTSKRTKKKAASKKPPK